jgi:hypothetical protein
MLDRRKFLRLGLWVAAAPVIVKASILMPVRALEIDVMDLGQGGYDYIPLPPFPYPPMPPQWEELFAKIRAAMQLSRDQIIENLMLQPSYMEVQAGKLYATRILG